jgi:uncharacterized protein (TIGR03382 family)
MFASKLLLPSLAIFALVTPAAAGSSTPIVVSPSHVSIKAGDSYTFAVATASTGSTQQVTLSTKGLPPDVQATFRPATIEMGQSANMTVSTDQHAVGGAIDFNVIASGGGTSYSGQASFTIDNGTGCCPAGYHAEGSYCVPDVHTGCSTGAGAPSAVALLGLAVLLLRRRLRVG